MLVFSVFSNIFLPTILFCVADSERWTHILDIFGIMNRNYYSGCDLYYMYSVEAVNVERILFWILFTAMLFCLAVGKRKRWFLGGILFLCACFVFYQYIQPAGYRYNGGWWGYGLNEQQYYSLLFEKDKDGIARECKEADFKMLKVQGSLSAKRVLNASLDVTVDRGDLEEYYFTLYHGYGIRSVADEEGNALTFEQDGDHVRIKNNDTKLLRKIHFEYEGYSKTYVATSQAVFLAGNFPYLPYPGWREYMSEPKENNWDVEYDLKGVGYPVEYDIQMETKYKVYSNLQEKESSHFVGTSEAATFMACSFIREMKIKNVTYYYSMLCVPYYPENIKETKKRIESTMDEIASAEQWNGMKIFDLTNAGGFEFVYCFAKDHMVAGLSDMKSFYPYYLEKGEIPNINEAMEGENS